MKILKEKGCKGCGEMYGCWEIISQTYSVENDCVRCDYEYKKKGCKLFKHNAKAIVIGHCYQCSKHSI